MIRSQTYSARLSRWRPTHRGYVLALLTAALGLLYLDRQVIALVAEPLKQEFGLSDTQLGLLTGPIFTIPFALLLIPSGLIVDRWNRSKYLGAALALWSLLTFLSGFVTGIVQLAIARMLVAAGETANNPAAMSIIADYYRKHERVGASAIYMTGTALASILGFLLIGYVAQGWGWRAAFMVAGIPGLIIALLLWISAREPVREGSLDPEGDARPSLPETFRFMLQQRSLLHLIFALALTILASSAYLTWITPLFMRVHGMTLAQTAFLLSIGYGVSTIVGQISVGLFIAYMARRDIRWTGKILAICATLASLFMLAMALTASFWSAAIFLVLWALTQAALYGPSFGTALGLATSRMRGVVAACMMLSMNILGAGLGPLIAGAISDAFAARANEFSIAWSLACISIFQLWAALHFFAAQRTIAGDMARAEHYQGQSSLTPSSLPQRAG